MTASPIASFFMRHERAMNKTGAALTFALFVRIALSIFMAIAVISSVFIFD